MFGEDLRALTQIPVHGAVIAIKKRLQNRPKILDVFRGEPIPPIAVAHSTHHSGLGCSNGSFALQRPSEVFFKAGKPLVNHLLVLKNQHVPSLVMKGKWILD